MQLRALFSEMDDRKCVVLSVVGVDGAQRCMQFLGGGVGIVVECGRWC
jgi:FtsZ-interacting cell division protein YlmF